MIHSNGKWMSMITRVIYIFSPFERGYRGQMLLACQPLFIVMGLRWPSPNPMERGWAWSPSLLGEVKKAGEEKQWKGRIGTEDPIWKSSVDGGEAARDWREQIQHNSPNLQRASEHRSSCLPHIQASPVFFVLSLIAPLVLFFFFVLISNCPAPICILVKI